MVRWRGKQMRGDEEQQLIPRQCFVFLQITRETQNAPSNHRVPFNLTSVAKEYNLNSWPADASSSSCTYQPIDRNRCANNGTLIAN